MRLALLAGGSPERSVEGTVSRLAKGLYQIHTEGLRDSELSLCVDGITPTTLIPVPGLMLQVNVPSNAQIKWLKRGTEKSINVIAERVS